MAIRQIIQCDHCHEDIDTTKEYVEVALRHNRLPNVAELRDMAVIPHGIEDEEAIKIRDERFASGGLGMVRDEVLLHFCNNDHFAQYRPQ